MKQLKELKRSKRILECIKTIIEVIVIVLVIGGLYFFRCSDNMMDQLAIGLIMAVLLVVALLGIKALNTTIDIESVWIINYQERKVVLDMLRSKGQEYVEIYPKNYVSMYTERERRLFQKNHGKFYARIVSDEAIELTVKAENGANLIEPFRINDFIYFTRNYII